MFDWSCFRLSRTPKDSNKSVDNEGDEGAPEEPGKRTEQETSSSPSPSPPVHEALNVICETESPTKIKIINVGNLTPDKKAQDVYKRQTYVMTSNITLIQDRFSTCCARMNLKHSISGSE